MLRRVLLGSFAALLTSEAFAQPRPLLDSLTQTDARRGVKDALALAAMNATGRLGRQDGFFGAPRVRIPLPGALGQAQGSLGRMGLGGPLDDLQLRLNRAAESTMGEAGRLFVSAVQTMTVSDAIDIVRGGDTSATTYLRGRTEPRLTTLLRPPMTTALTQSGAFVLLRQVASSLSMGSATADLRGQIIEFATTKALDGAFLYIGEEERAIRHDPVRRTTDILRRVFG